MAFHDPWWLIAMALPLAVLVASPMVKRPGLRFPSVSGLREIARRSRVHWLKWPHVLRASALLLIVIALARPQQGLESSRLTAEGIDIVLAIDVSTSMLAEDFTLRGARRNRLEVVKEVVTAFVSQRPNDRIGLVVFAGRAYTQCPLTLDHSWLLAQLDRVAIGLAEDGTAIGSGIATGLNRLRSSKAKSRVMVLLTDGVNNAGAVTPDAAAQLAKALDVRIYTIGAGTKGLVPYPATDMFGRKVYQQVQIEVDDEGLTRIAKAAGGQYFRATDTDSLRKIYGEIDRMETVTIEQPAYVAYREWYPWFVVPAILLLLVELGLAETWLRALP